MVTTPFDNEDLPAERLGLLDAHLPTHDVVLTEHLGIEGYTGVVFEAAKSFDFMTTTSPLVTALMTARSVPSRVSAGPSSRRRR